MPTIRRDDADLAYTVQGRGPGLVLVHGTGARGTTTWSPLLRQLSDARAVVMPDLRGSGGTHDGEEPLELDVLAEDVLAAAVDADLDEFDLAGFSLGGAVAATLAASAPNRVRSLTLIAAPLSGLDGRTRLQFDFWKDLYALDAALFARYWLLAGLSPQFVAAIPDDELASAASFPIEAGLGRQSALNSRIDLTPVVTLIRARTLVIGCTHDTIVPARQARALAAAIPEANYLELDAGHMVILEAPGIVARKLLEHANAGRAVG